MKVDEPGTLDASLGISRRTLLRRGAIVGGAMVWATPVVQTFGGPVAAAGTPAQDISYLAVLIQCGAQHYRMKWDVEASGLDLDTGPNFAVPGCSTSLQPVNGGVTDGPAPGTSASLTPSGAILLDLGPDCTLVDFRVKRGSCCAGPGTAGEPGTGQTGGTVLFPGPTSNQEGCA